MRRVASEQRGETAVRPRPSRGVGRLRPLDSDSMTICQSGHCLLFYGAEGLSARLRFYRVSLWISQLVFDIALRGNWADLLPVYNATCSGGRTGVCVSFSMLSANGELK